jgi:hypothetical protein
VLTSHVVNFSREEFPFVWNELPVRASSETGLEFTTDLLRETTEAHLGEPTPREVARFRGQLAETPVELEVQDRPSVNVAQKESWRELRVEYLVNPKRAQRTRNELYERVLRRPAEHPDRGRFPVSPADGTTAKAAGTDSPLGAWYSTRQPRRSSERRARSRRRC